MLILNGYFRLQKHYPRFKVLCTIELFMGIIIPVRVLPPLYGRLATASNKESLVLWVFRCHSVLGSPLYWARPRQKKHIFPNSEHLT